MDIRTSWDLSPLLAGDNDARADEWRKEMRQRTDLFVDKWKPRTDWLSDPEVLKEALSEYEEWSRECSFGGNEGYYFSLKTALNENDPGLKARNDKIEELAKELSTEIQFFELQLAKVPAETQARFLADEDMTKWRHFLARIFAQAAHLLSDPEEKILTLLSGPAHGHWVRMTSGFLSREEREVPVEGGGTAKQSFSDLLTLLESQDKTVRDAAASAVNEILRKHADVAEAEVNAILAEKKIEDDLRKFARPDASRHLADDIETETVDALINTVAGHFDIPSRFYALKARLMGVEKLAYHERKVPYGNLSKKYSFPEAAELVAGVFQKLDQEFADILTGFLSKGQIDVHPNKGKAGGAFCAHYTTKHPTYILLNYGETLNDVQTLAHEVGHGINNELMRAKQTDLNFGAPTSTAEVASTFMEDFVLEEVMRTADKETRLALMLEKLGDDVATIFRQTAAYRFEQELHQEFRVKGYLSKEGIGGIFRKHMESYMGEAVEQSEGSENWWIYWSHFRNFFYVYSYAGGLLISKAMQAGVREDPGFMGKVKEFLSAGTSDSPKNIFARMGIDIADPAFWERGIGETERLLGETEALARDLGRI